MRDKRLDFVKGLCISLVVWGHLPRMGTCHEELECAVHWIYTFHVPVFAIITGYLFGNKQGTLVEVKSVVNKMFKPYLTMCFVSAVLFYIARLCSLPTSVEMPMDSVGAWLYTIVTGKGSGAAWYLHTFGILQLTVISVMWLCRLRKVPCTWSVVAVSIGVVMAIMSYYRLCVGTFFSIYFLIGYFVRRCKVELPSSYWFVLSAFLIVLTFESEYPFCKIFLSLSALGVMMRVAECALLRNNVAGRAVEYVGRHTLSILLFHNLFAVFYRPLSGSILSIERTGILLNVVMMVAILASCIFAECIIKRTSFKKLIW